jgi:predicted house-cleaning NTP pyrophosphatase (Maf/HAM1 superfamily)
MAENIAPSDTDPRLTALRLAEEQACAGYVTARKDQITLAGQVVSLHQLTVEQPRRSDYRSALTCLASRYRDAKQRTITAYDRWVAAQLHTDEQWTDTTGRTRGRATPAASAPVGGGQAA